LLLALGEPERTASMNIFETAVKLNREPFLPRSVDGVSCRCCEVVGEDA